MDDAHDSDSVTVQVPQLKPVTDPHELKNLAVREYADKAQRMGRTVSSAALERFAVQELNLVDAFHRWARPASPKPRPAPAPAPPKNRLAELGLKPVERSSRERLAARTRVPLTERPVLDVSQKLAAGMARILQIMEHGAEKATDFDKAIANAAVPRLAREFLRAWTGHKLRHRISRHNPFAGLSDVDADRMLERCIYDICDRSTGVLGPWWVR